LTETEIELNGSSRTTNYTYDSCGNILKIVTDSVEYTFEYGTQIDDGEPWIEQ